MDLGSLQAKIQNKMKRNFKKTKAITDLRIEKRIKLERKESSFVENLGMSSDDEIH